MIRIPEDVFYQAEIAAYPPAGLYDDDAPNLRKFAQVIAEWFDQTYRLSDTRHLVKVHPAGWTVQHPQSCRPNLFTCPWGGGNADQSQLDYAVERGPHGVFVGHTTTVPWGAVLVLGDPASETTP